MARGPHGMEGGMRVSDYLIAGWENAGSVASLVMDYGFSYWDAIEVVKRNLEEQ